MYKKNMFFTNFRFTYNILCSKNFSKLVFHQTLNPLLFYAILKFDSKGQYMHDWGNYEREIF